jgi:hypothetical protein
MRVLLAAVFFLCLCRLDVAAQTPAETPSASAAPAATGPLYLLVPYGEPGNKDQHAAGVSQSLETDLRNAGVNVKTLLLFDHLVAVDTAAQLCAENGAVGLLIAEGRSEQTAHTTMIPMSPVQLTRFPAHVELRLDDVDCNGNVRWSGHATADLAATGATIEFANTTANVGAAVDEGFRKTAEATVDAFAKAQTADPSPVPSVRAPVSSAAGAYALVPFEQPFLADPRAPDITRAFAEKLRARKLDVQTVKAMDRLTAVAAAPELCARYRAGAILVPEVRLEQTRRTHAELRVDRLDCSGHVTGTGFSIADIGGASGGRGMIDGATAAMDSAVDQVLSMR